METPNPASSLSAEEIAWRRQLFFNAPGHILWLEEKAPLSAPAKDPMGHTIFLTKQYTFLVEALNGGLILSNIVTSSTVERLIEHIQVANRYLRNFQAHVDERGLDVMTFAAEERNVRGEVVNPFTARDLLRSVGKVVSRFLDSVCEGSVEVDGKKIEDVARGEKLKEEIHQTLKEFDEFSE